jgi:anaerobic selenocysteine-containing dehydrogenase
VTTYKNPLTTQSKYGPYNIPTLAEIMLENWIEINSVDAAMLGIGNDDIVQVTTPVGMRIAKAKVREGIAQGVIAFAQSFGH